MTSKPRRPRKSSTTGPIELPVMQLPHAEGLPLPAYQTAGAAGLDLVAAVPENAPLNLTPGKRALVPTGLVMALPPGFEAQVRPRSGLAVKHGITVLNSPGTIDSDYRGEVQVLLVNLGDRAFEIVRGERIAQLVVAPVTFAGPRLAKSLDGTPRGAGGFGSTGTASAAPRQHKDRAPVAKSKAVPRRRPAGKRAAKRR